MPQPLPDKTIGSPFIELQSIDSTNNYARLQIDAGLAQHGTTIFAHEQEAGKGQWGKRWASEKGANIMMSMLVKPQPLPLGSQFHLNACVAKTIHEFFSRYAGDDTTIKWPNDLYWQDRKAGGVLIENIVRSSELGVSSTSTIAHTSTIAQWDWSIIGIGININQTIFPPHLPNPVSLKQITGKSFDVIDLTRQLCEILNTNFKLLQEDGFEKIYNSYLVHLYKKDKKVMLKKGIRVFEAVIQSVSPSGKLVVQHGIEEEFDFGEIEWVM